MLKENIVEYISVVEELEVGLRKGQKLYLVGFSMKLLQRDIPTPLGASLVTCLHALPSTPQTE